MTKNLNVKHILVIRFRRVGDSVLATALCSSLRLTFPDAKIDFVVNKGIHTLYENHPDIDRLIVYDDKQCRSLPRYLAWVWRVMHDTHYDVIIDMRTTVKTLWFSLFSLRTPYRIGRRKVYGTGILTHRVDHLADNTVDRVRQNLLLMQPLAEVAPLRTTEAFTLHVEPEHKARFRRYMQEQGIDFARPVVMATVTARLIYKVWDKERMEEILRRIIREYDAQVIFNFAGAEREMAMLYRHELGDDPHIFTQVEARSLPDLCALLSNCDFFFGNEGGPRHMAQALGVPSYAIFPPNIWKGVWLPGHDERYQGISPDDFMPYAEQRAAGWDYARRFSLVTVERVWEGLRPMLDRYLRPASSVRP